MERGENIVLFSSWENICVVPNKEFDDKTGGHL